MKFCDKTAYEVMVDIHIRLVFMFVGLLILQTNCEISGAFIRSFSNGGIVGGDPAPGRSPGPPTLQGTSEEYPSILLNAIDNYKECSFNTNSVVATNSLVNVEITHRLFKTDVLVPNVVYQVILSRANEGNDIIKFTATSSIHGRHAGNFAKTDGTYKCNEYEITGDLTSELHLDWSFTHNDDKTTSRKNVTFEISYRIKGTHNTYRIDATRYAMQGCQLWLKQDKATLTHKDFPRPADCQTWFPNQNTEHGLVVDITRLNVPCTGGYLHFSGLNITQYTQNHRQTHVCGKLEQLPESDKHIYLPSSHIHPFLQIHGTPVFTLNYRLVDHCYNVTFLARNGSFELKPTTELDCTFHIYLPYGYRVQLLLEVGDSTSTGVPETSDLQLKDSNKKGTDCKGLFTQLLDGENTWTHCTRTGDAEKRIEMVSRENKVMLKVSVRSVSTSALGLQMSYRAEAVEEITGLCGFGWVAVRQFCISAVEGAKLPWAQAEMECRRREGHLVSVRNEHTQRIINNMIMNSPVYSDHNSYWIGATDKSHDGDFRWSDGLPFSYTNWFPGWQQHGFYNRQPNDDGLSNQDCVEMRRMFSLPSSAADLTPSFMWNDRDCATPNYFICERLQTNEQLEEGWPLDCNRSIVLTRQQPRAAIASPGFPKQYPDNVDCDISITAPPGYRLILDFEELVLENEPSCSYDYLEIVEDVSNSANANNSNVGHRRLCGDWSSKLKLLRHISGGARLRLKFSSDYSHHFGGFKARVSIENTLQCEDDRLHLFNNSCYLFVNYPEVTWTTAQKICEGVGANLASVLSPEEENFVTTNIRTSPEYRTSAIYWIGVLKPNGENMRWVDGSELQYLGWLPGQKPEKLNGDLCLSIQWMVSPTPMLPSGLYWKFQKCTAVGGYVCKRPSLTHSIDLNVNRTLNGTAGNLTTPNFPSKYYNNLHYYMRIIGPENTRITVVFRKIDIEHQSECLYDYIQLNDGDRICGTHEYDLDNFNFVSNNNKVVVRFYSDFSVTGSGFLLEWKAVEMIGCPKQTLTAKEGTLTSPNYPHFLLPHLECSVTIRAPAGKRIWLEFEDHDFKDVWGSNEANLQLSLHEELASFQPFLSEDLLTEGVYVSYGEYLNIQLKTQVRPKGKGYKALYRIVDDLKEERTLLLSNVTTGTLLHLNFPDQPASDIDFKQHLLAPLGYSIFLQLHNVELANTTCLNNQSVLKVYDNYSSANGTLWHLCSIAADEQNSIPPPVPIVITSFLNSIYINQVNLKDGFLLNASVQVQEDPNYKNKLLRRKNNYAELCHLYPCLNNGECITNATKEFCKCSGHFTGPLCAFTLCELEPCAFGKCELTPAAFVCHCKSGYTGLTCSKKKRPCEPNPCENRGTCMEKGTSFKCSCKAWWEGPRCERKMQKIPYTPLTERMFHEPFWLGLMTVTVVMGVIGLVWCAKRHFPEKIEKLLAEDDRNQSTMSSLRSASVREQLAASGAAAITVTPSPGPGAPKSLFGRLGIRKPSILSLTSPHASGYVPATARTFSLDDLLKPPLRRTPSPKKKRNNSTPTKKNVTEKKQILQQLISPAASRQNSKKINLGELMQLDDRITIDLEAKHEEETAVKETKFSDKNNTSQAILNDPKLEKKVTFARLLNKVSAEMSSSSEIEMGIMQTNRLGYVFARPSSTPPSPIIDSRSPNSTCSNHGSGSLTSSDLAIPSALSNSISDFLSSRRQIKSPGKQKPASADSILAMFRNFSTTSMAVNVPSSLKVTPSTTPTASSPQDDAIADDDSSTSSLHTPISFSSGPPDSPISQHRQNQSTIEIPVLDAFSAHKSPGGGGNFLHPPTILLEIPSTINKCLSPIREMPTPLPSPMPSPALTPIMKRNPASSAPKEADFIEESISVELPQMSIIFSDTEEESRNTDMALDPQGEDGLILEEAAVMQKSSNTSKVKAKNRLSPLGHCKSPTKPQVCCESSAAHPLIIPTLTIQTPSPTHTCLPSILIPGSPPPQRKFSQPECNFELKQPRKLLKEFDKPTSLDLPGVPPLITITCNMSETESDAESTSPATKSSSHLSASSAGMSYLSPFPIGARTEHNASESNLSSSGYSSMASPGPSRCGSNNPLCPSEMEDPGAGGHYPHLGKRPSAQLKSCFPANNETSNNKENNEKRVRSDSETLSDDPLVESNDEGIGTDQLDEKVDDGELKSANELEVFVISDVESVKGFKDFYGSKSCVLTNCDKSLDDYMDHLVPPSSNYKNSLQLPSVVVQCENNNEKHLSPLSSRSESPLSDRTSGIDRFSSKFYGQHKDLLPFTDSDGLYDFPSSDKVNVTSLTHQYKKSTSRKREKKLSRNCKTPSPTKSITANSFYYNLDVPIKEPFYKITSPRKPSPKRRLRPQVVSSSSSSESIVSAKEGKQETVKWPAQPDGTPIRKCRKSSESSEGEIADDASSVMLPKTEELFKHSKINRLRAISHQIRFLRRLERSLKRRERTKSPSDSIGSDCDDDHPKVTSPLLQQDGQKSKTVSRNKRGKLRRSENLSANEEYDFKQSVFAGNGYSD